MTQIHSTRHAHSMALAEQILTIVKRLNVPTVVTFTYFQGRMELGWHKPCLNGVWRLFIDD